MTLEFVLLLLAGAFAGGFVNGLAGFGTSLFALGWWLQVMEPLEAVALALVISVISGVPGIMVVRKSIEWPRLARFLIPALIGIPIGLRLLHEIDAELLKLVVAGFLILYGGYFAFRRELPRMTHDLPAVDASVGFAGGILGAVAGLSGALPTMWCSLRPWPKGQQRALLQPFNVIVLGLSAVWLLVEGVYGRALGLSILVAIPATLIATQLGIRAFEHLSDNQFRRLLIVLMLVSGVALVLRDLL